MAQAVAGQLPPGELAALNHAMNLDPRDHDPLVQILPGHRVPLIRQQAAAHLVPAGGRQPSGNEIRQAAPSLDAIIAREAARPAIDTGTGAGSHIARTVQNALEQLPPNELRALQSLAEQGSKQETPGG